MILDELTELRDSLYDSLPVGEVDAFKMINAIKEHIKNLDKLIETYEKVKNDT